MMELVLYIAGLAASAFMAFNIGANDATNPIDTAVGAGALTLKQALILFSVFTIIGALLQGSFVIKTIGKGIVPEIDVVAALITVVAAGAWILTATLLGLPISTSQSIAGAVIGIGIAYTITGLISLEEINWSVVTKIVLSWIISPAIAMTLAMLLYRFFLKLERSMRDKHDVRKIFLYLHIAALAFAAYAFGSNDVANATGVYLTVTQKQLGMPGFETMIFLALLGGLFIAIGGFTLGRRVVETTAYRITRLDHPSGVAAGFSLALTVWLFTTIPHMIWGFGMPISTTHTSVSSIMGVGIVRARGLRGLNLKVAAYIILSWLLTLPVTIGIATGLYLVVKAFL
ncbi:MAG: inorganic phosphate transporter [Candidatus Nezhaarchaeales archaeon]